MYINNRILINLSGEKLEAVNQIKAYHPLFAIKYPDILSRMTVCCIEATLGALDKGINPKDIIKIVRTQSKHNENMASHIRLLSYGLRSIAFSCQEKKGIYKTGEVPESYRCTICGAHGVKLWRVYGANLDQQMLFCACCAEKKQSPRKDLDEIDLVPWVVDEMGRIPSSFFSEDRTDQLQIKCYGTIVPAIPTEEADNYYGYTSVPQNGCNWYYKLPTRLN